MKGRGEREREREGEGKREREKGRGKGGAGKEEREGERGRRRGIIAKRIPTLTHSILSASYTHIFDFVILEKCIFERSLFNTRLTVTQHPHFPLSHTYTHILSCD